MLLLLLAWWLLYNNLCSFTDDGLEVTPGFNLVALTTWYLALCFLLKEVVTVAELLITAGLTLVKDLVKMYAVNVDALHNM